jgi:hypothetical protein
MRDEIGIFKQEVKDYSKVIRAPIELANYFDLSNICQIMCKLNLDFISLKFVELYL